MDLVVLVCTSKAGQRGPERVSEQGSYDVKAGGRRVSYARKMSCVRSRVVESQRSVQRSSDATCQPHLFSLVASCLGYFLAQSLPGTTYL